MTPSEIVEAVARIIDPEAWQATEDGRDAIPDSLWGVRREIACQRARQAILATLKAVREPTERMLAKGATFADPDLSSDEVEGTWRLMIDALLHDMRGE